MNTNKLSTLLTLFTALLLGGVLFSTFFNTGSAQGTQLPQAPLELKTVGENVTSKNTCGPGTTGDEFCVVSENPFGPGCNPALTNCDITGGELATIKRVDAETGNNEITPFYLEGTTLFSNLSTASPSFLKSWYSAETGIEPFYLSKVVKDSINDNSLRGAIDNYLQNTFAYQLFQLPSSTAVEIIEERNSHPVNGPTKFAPGIFPLGYQYELTDAVKNTMQASKGWATGGEKLKYTPSFNYMITPVRAHGEITHYENIMSTPIFSDRLIKILRIKEPYACEPNCIKTASLIMDPTRTQSFKQREGNTMIAQPGWEFLLFLSSYTERRSILEAVNNCFMRGGRLPDGQELFVAHDKLSNFSSGFKVLSNDMMLFDNHNLRVFSLRSFVESFGSHPHLSQTQIEHGLHGDPEAFCVFD